MKATVAGIDLILFSASKPRIKIKETETSIAFPQLPDGWQHQRTRPAAHHIAPILLVIVSLSVADRCASLSLFLFLFVCLFFFIILFSFYGYRTNDFHPPQTTGCPSAYWSPFHQWRVSGCASFTFVGLVRARSRAPVSGDAFIFLLHQRKRFTHSLSNYCGAVWGFTFVLFCFV